MKKLMVCLACCTILFSLAVPMLAGTRTPGINHRQAHQQARISQGVRSGELTYREARRLESQEARVKPISCLPSPRGTCHRLNGANSIVN
jgi:hypothetical protein